MFLEQMFDQCCGRFCRHAKLPLSQPVQGLAAFDRPLSVRRYPRKQIIAAASPPETKMIESSLARALLSPFAKLYELVVRARIVAYERGLLKTYRLRAPVISVGNLTVGGTGKTPCVAFIARALRDAGYTTAILSRGYRRSSTGRVEVSNERQILCSPQESGDEPYLLAQSCPGVRVVVDEDRYAAGQWLEQRAPISVFLLDDAFQHLRLARDLNLLLVDATEPFAEAKMVPFGRLREPLAGLRRADAVVATRSDRAFDRALLVKTIESYTRPNTPIFFAHHEMAWLRGLTGTRVIPLAEFAKKSVAAVSGIAKPDRFSEDLQKAGMRIVLRRDFEDHHRYTAKEFVEIVDDARSAMAEAVIVTEKDAANLPAGAIQRSPLPLYAAQIEFRCEEEAALKNLVLAAASRGRMG
jgi:tetraacyldisaccharide 4'-kinase